MKHNNLILVILLFMLVSTAQAQQSKYIKYLVDSISSTHSSQLKLPIDSGFMVVERLTITKNGKAIYYSVRNGYDSANIAEILKIEYRNKKWQKPIVFQANKSGAPALSADGNTMFFQYDHPVSPKGVFTIKTENGWSKPTRFLDTLSMSHYLQSPKNNTYYYAALTGKNNQARDIFKVNVSKTDTTTENLGFNLIGPQCCTDLFVARDESYLIIAMYKQGNDSNYQFHGSLDLFIAFKNEMDHWSKPVNLGEMINGVSEWTWGPYVTDDNKFLFFSSWTATVGVRMIRFDKVLDHLKTKARW